MNGQTVQIPGGRFGSLDVSPEIVDQAARELGVDLEGLGIDTTLSGDYSMARPNRFRRKRKGVPAVGTSGDYHIRADRSLAEMWELARSLDRDDIVVGQGVNRLCANVIAAGFTLDPDTGDGDLDADLRAAFLEWADDPAAVDAAGVHAFSELERLVYRSTIVDGDIFLNPLSDGSLEVLEAHRVRNPTFSRRTNLVHGVELSPRRERLRYWVATEDVDPRSPLRVNEFSQLAARNEDGSPGVFHVFRPERLTLTRGVSAFARLVDSASLHSDLHFAALVKQQVAACFVVIRELDARAGSQPGASSRRVGSRSTETRADGTTRYIENLRPGTEVTGRPGEKVTGFAPNVVTGEFFQHVHLVLTTLAVNLDMPVQVLLLDPTDTNFSGWRGAIDQARQSWRLEQRNVVRRFHRPVYRWKLAQFAERDAAFARAFERLGDRFLRHKWIPAEWRYIDPYKEAQGDALLEERGLDSPRRIAGRRGLDFETLERERVADNRLRITGAIEAARQINEEHADAGVSWRDVLYPYRSGAPEEAPAGGDDE